MQVAERVDERARLEPANMRHHQREQGVGSDVERHTQEQIRAALVELAAQLTFLHIELKERVTRRQGHLLDLAYIPRADDQPTAVRVGSDLLDHVINLMDGTPFRRAPVAPLRPIDPAQVSVSIRPLIPDAHPMLVEPANVRISTQKPKQLVDDGLEMELLGGEDRETLTEWES